MNDGSDCQVYTGHDPCTIIRALQLSLGFGIRARVPSFSRGHGIPAIAVWYQHLRYTHTHTHTHTQ